MNLRQTVNNNGNTGNNHIYHNGRQQQNQGSRTTFEEELSVGSAYHRFGQPGNLRYSRNIALEQSDIGGVGANPEYHHLSSGKALAGTCLA